MNIKSFISEPSGLRTAVMIILALIIGLGVAFTAFTASNYHEGKLKSDDVTKEELAIDSDGTFSGKFRSEKTGRQISGIKYKIDDGNLYITVLATMGEKKALETDEDGYVTLTIKGLSEVKEVFYRTGNKDESLTVNGVSE